MNFRFRLLNQSSSVRFSSRPPGELPAQVTRMSMRPKRSIVSATVRSTSSTTLMSPRSSTTSPPVSAESSSAVRRRSSSPRAVIATVHPSCASRRAVALPMPLLAPVTNATVPWSPRSITPPLGRTPTAPDDRASASRDRRPREPAARGTEDLGGREQRFLAVRRGDQLHADREAGVRRGERDGEGGEPRDVGGRGEPRRPSAMDVHRGAVAQVHLPGVDRRRDVRRRRGDEQVHPIEGPGEPAPDPLRAGPRVRQLLPVCRTPPEERGGAGAERRVAGQPPIALGERRPREPVPDAMDVVERRTVDVALLEPGVLEAFRYLLDGSSDLERASLPAPAAEHADDGRIDTVVRPVG